MKKVLAFLRAAVKEFLDGRCSLHAAGLTYYSLLSFIPVLCLLLTLAKTLGAGDCARRFVNERIDTFIEQVESGGEMPAFLQLPGLTEEKKAARRTAAQDVARQARVISNSLFDRVNAFQVGALGWIGFLGLIWTVISTLSTIEDSMNGIWKVEHRRSWPKRICLYVLVSTVLPLLVAVALSMPVMHGVIRVLDATVGAVAYTRGLGEMLVAVLKSSVFGFCLTALFATLAFAFALGFMPHTRVNRLAALEGGAATAVLMWVWLKACTVAQVGIAGASALYGSFSFLPILLAWLYVSWRIFLFGGVLTHAFHCLHSSLRAGDRIG